MAGWNFRTAPFRVDWASAVDIFISLYFQNFGTACANVLVYFERIKQIFPLWIIYAIVGGIRDRGPRWRADTANTCPPLLFLHERRLVCERAPEVGKKETSRALIESDTISENNRCPLVAFECSTKKRFRLPLRFHVKPFVVLEPLEAEETTGLSQEIYRSKSFTNSMHLSSLYKFWLLTI